jgi:hypothetical protein
MHMRLRTMELFTESLIWCQGIPGCGRNKLSRLLNEHRLLIR